MSTCENGSNIRTFPAQAGQSRSVTASEPRHLPAASLKMELEMIISRTPVRLSFFGGGTDYPVFFETFGGAVLGGDHRQVRLTISGEIASPNSSTTRSASVTRRQSCVTSTRRTVYRLVREMLKYRRVEGKSSRHPHLRRPARQDRPRLFVGVHGRISQRPLRTRRDPCPQA